MGFRLGLGSLVPGALINTGNREYMEISQYNTSLGRTRRAREASPRQVSRVLPKHPRALATVLTDLYIFSITVLIKAQGRG